VKGLKFRKGDGLADILKVGEDDEIVIVTALGKTIRIAVKGIRQIGRNNGVGMKIMSLDDGDYVQSAALVENELEDEI
ncbi:MAG TPA: DNA gyrase C-terminal beta-propeller domain-containing protein, partial [bacterium]|nr:DNA gyrase C-terminal beta-propeller domain-containing protein [bacterium]